MMNKPTTIKIDNADRELARKIAKKTGEKLNVVVHKALVAMALVEKANGKGSRKGQQN